MMHGHGKSDSSIVRTKPPNEAEPEAKEAVDGRGLAKGNLLKRNMSRTQGRPGMPGALERIRQAARRDKRQRFTALLHHVYDVERLRVQHTSRSGAKLLQGSTGRGGTKERSCKGILRISRSDSSEEPIEPSLCVGRTSPRWASRVSFGRSEWRCWKIRLFSAPRWRCLTRSTRRTL